MSQEIQGFIHSNAYEAKGGDIRRYELWFNTEGSALTAMPRLIGAFKTAGVSLSPMPDAETFKRQSLYHFDTLDQEGKLAHVTDGSWHHALVLDVPAPDVHKAEAVIGALRAQSLG